MKKLCIFLFAFMLFTPNLVKADIQPLPNHNMETRKFDMQKHHERERAFEQQLKLTEDQKQLSKQLRHKQREEMIPLFKAVQQKKQEIEVVKLSRISTEMQNEKIAVLEEEIASLEKQIKDLKKKNMKEFENLLTPNQRKILKKMKQEGRKKFEEEQRLKNNQ